MTNDHERLVVPAEANGQRLDQFVARATKHTRGSVQRMIAQGTVRLDGVASARDTRLETGQRIELLPSPPAVVAQPHLHPTVIDEDEAMIVLDKPGGLVMHPAEGIREPTLVDWLITHAPSIRGVGEDANRPGIVHRLDREASGLLVVAKTSNAFDHFRAAFKDHRVKKHYRVLVNGLVEPDADTITFPIERGEGGRMVAKPIGGAGRNAESSFTVVERRPPFTLLDVTTRTGRTHQVRVHLNAYGHPVAGDSIYFQKRFRGRRQPPRLFLHATALRFPHPDGGERSYESPLPNILASYFTMLVSSKYER